MLAVRAWSSYQQEQKDDNKRQERWYDGVGIAGPKFAKQNS
jgi:hypothetical protein